MRDLQSMDHLFSAEALGAFESKKAFSYKHSETVFKVSARYPK